MKQQVEEREEGVLLIDAVVEVDQDLKEETIETTEEAETRDQLQDLKEETIETTEEAEMRDQLQDLKEETIETTEEAEMRDQTQDLKEEVIEIEETITKMKAEKENPLVLRKNLVERRSLLKRVLEIRKKNFQGKNKNLETKFHR